MFTHINLQYTGPAKPAANAQPAATVGGGFGGPGHDLFGMSNCMTTSNSNAPSMVQLHQYTCTKHVPQHHARKSARCTNATAHAHTHCALFHTKKLSLCIQHTKKYV